MKDLKKLLKICLYPSLYYSIIIFLIYLGYLVLNVSGYIIHSGLNKESDLLKIVLYICLIGQMLFITTLPYKKNVLSTMPIEKIYLYPIATTIVYLFINLLYMLPFWIYEAYLGLEISWYLIIRFIKISIIIEIFKLMRASSENSLFSNDSSIGIYWIYFLINPILIFISRYTNSYIALIFPLIMLVILTVYIFLNWGWIKEKKSKRKKYNKSEIIRLNFDNNNNTNSLISKLKWTSINPILLLLMIVYIPFKGFDYLTSGANYNFLFFSIAIIGFYENGDNILSLVGLPVTPREIYLINLKTKIKIIFSVLVLSMLFDIFFNGVILPETYLLNLVWIFGIILANELFYSSYRVINISYTIMSIAILLFTKSSTINTDVFLLIFLNLVFLIGVYTIVKFNLNNINILNNDLSDVLKLKSN